MFEGILANGANIIIGAIVFVAIALATRYVYKTRKTGGCSGCSGCSSSSGGGCDSRVIR